MCCKEKSDELRVLHFDEYSKCKCVRRPSGRPSFVLLRGGVCVMFRMIGVSSVVVDARPCGRGNGVRAVVATTHNHSLTRARTYVQQQHRENGEVKLRSHGETYNVSSRCMPYYLLATNEYTRRVRDASRGTEGRTRGT